MHSVHEVQIVSLRSLAVVKRRQSLWSVLSATPPIKGARNADTAPFVD